MKKAKSIWLGELGSVLLCKDQMLPSLITEKVKYYEPPKNYHIARIMYEIGAYNHLNIAVFLESSKTDQAAIEDHFTYCGKYLINGTVERSPKN